MLTVYAMEISEIYGHGRRLVIWFSGCSLRCDGCINAYLWDKSAGKELIIADIMKNVKGKTELSGVTFIGGEPLEQGELLLSLSQKIIDSGKDIVLFTGYELNELNDVQKKIADKAVVIISGRYDKTKRDTFLRHRGSGNQTVIVKNESLKQYYFEECRQVEVEITDNGEKYLGFSEDFLV